MNDADIIDFLSSIPKDILLKCAIPLKQQEESLKEPVLDEKTFRKLTSKNMLKYILRSDDHSMIIYTLYKSIEDEHKEKRKKRKSRRL